MKSTKSHFSLKFTEEKLLEILKKNNGNMLRVLALDMGCGERTARNLLKPLVESGRVIKKNLGSEKKPTYVYYLQEEK